MSQLELEAESYQVEVIGEAAPIGKKLIVNGHDISHVTSEVRLRIPANGHVEADITLIPMKLAATVEVEVDRIRLWIEGISQLLSAAEKAAEVLEDNIAQKPSPLADRLRAAMRKVEMGI